MKKVVLNMTIQTTRPLGEREILHAILKRVCSVPTLKLEAFGFSEPLKQQWGENSFEYLAPLYQSRGAIGLFRLASPIRGLLTINTTRNPLVVCNEIQLLADYTGVYNLLKDFEKLLHDLTILVGSDYAAATLSGGDPFSVNVKNPEENYGEIECHRIPPANPIGMRFLNGIWWINVFGKRYLEFFKEQTFENLPGYRAERITPDLFWLQPTKDPLEMFSKPGLALREIIKSTLNRPKAFYGYEAGKPGIMLKYDTPCFEFNYIQSSEKNII